MERDDVDGDITSEWAEEFFARRDPRDLIEVVIETGAGDSEIEALSGLFDDLGVPALVTAGYRRRSVDELLPWVMMIKAPLVVFVTAMAAKAGSDAWDALRVMISRVYEIKRKGGRRLGSITVEDVRRTVVLTDAIPEEALRALIDGNVPPAPYLVWDPETGVWTDPLGGLESKPQLDK